MVVWKRNMAGEIEAERGRARHELRSLAALKRRPSPEGRVAVQHLESLKRLEALGYRAMLSDSLRHQINAGIEAALEALEEDLEASMEAQEEVVEEQMEELEEIEDMLEAQEENGDDEQDEDNDGDVR
jgi:hypothetical protein